MRAVWTGSIGFGLVSIPVRLYPATSPQDARFHLVDRATGARVRNRRVVAASVEPPADLEVERAPAAEPDEASASDAEASRLPAPEPSPAAATANPLVAGDVAEPREVTLSEIVRGYEVEPGRHVLVEQEELERLRPEPTRTIDIEHFVGLDEIDPVYFEKSYHLAPADEIAEKPYHLLRQAMEEEGRVAIGRFVLRTREHLVAIRPTLGVLGLETLYFADEVREPAARWTQPERTRPGREVEMARKLIEGMLEPWDPARYRDPYRERVLDLIRERQPVDAAVEEEAAGSSAAVPDLMAALKASVEQLTKQKNESRKRRKGTTG